MSSWPSNWQRDALRACGIPVSQFALDVLSAWQRSTPTEPWTNNPLGMPSLRSGYQPALFTLYAHFPTMTDFRSALKRYLLSVKGKGVLDTLIMAESYPAAWREIHALKWPANATESEYPVVLMDMIEARYTSKASKRERPVRTTTGSTHAAPNVHQIMRKQSDLLYQAATHLHGARRGINHIMKGMNGHG